MAYEMLDEFIVIKVELSESQSKDIRDSNKKEQVLILNL